MRPALPEACPAVSALAVALLTLTPSACQQDASCEENVETVERCNRVFRSDPCADTGGTCQVACFAMLTCDEFLAVDSGDYPAWLTRCLTKCTNTFVCNDGTNVDVTWECDGSADCADGSDEGESCRYHRCADGQAVQSKARCNGYSECGDGSDEQGCP